jgi:hypothetical protein
MGIIDFLQNEIGARLTYYRQWVIWDDDDKYWKVYKEGPKGIGKQLIETTDEEEAIAKLIY